MGSELRQIVTNEGEFRDTFDPFSPEAAYCKRWINAERELRDAREQVRQQAERLRHIADAFGRKTSDQAGLCVAAREAGSKLDILEQRNVALKRERDEARGILATTADRLGVALQEVGIHWWDGKDYDRSLTVRDGVVALYDKAARWRAEVESLRLQLEEARAEEEK